MKPRFSVLSSLLLASMAALFPAPLFESEVAEVVDENAQSPVPDADVALRLADETAVDPPARPVVALVRKLKKLTSRLAASNPPQLLTDAESPEAGMRLAQAQSLSLAVAEAVPSPSPVVLAQPSDPNFLVGGYSFSGNTLLAIEEIEQLLVQYTSPAANFQLIQKAVAALEARYGERGFGAVKVLLPEQDIENGVVNLRIVEGHIGQVVVRGQQYFSEENIRASLPALQEGGQPNMHAIDASLRVLNEHPAKQTTLTFRQGSKPGEVDAFVRVVDENPLRFALSFDNSGAPDQHGKYPTGRYRSGFIVQHANLFDKDHALSFQYMTSPELPDKVTILGGAYRIPLYEAGSVLELAFAYSNVDSGKLMTAVGPVSLSGSGQTYALKYEKSLPSSAGWQQSLAYGLDYRIYNNRVQTEGSGAQLVPDSVVHPVSIAYNAKRRFEETELSAGMSYVHNIPGGTDGTTADFQKPGGRSEATANYQLWRYHFSATQRLPADWFVKMAVSGQYSRDALVSGELYGVGGSDSVRGFYEREVSGDQGQRGSIELYTPELGGGLGMGDGRLRGVAFYDAAAVKRNKPQPGEQLAESIASAGVGLRGNLGKNLSFRIDLGVVTEPGGSHQVGDRLLHTSLIGFF